MSLHLASLDRVGLYLAGADDCTLIRNAVIECGLEPVDLDDRAGQIALHADPAAAGAAPNLLLLITDRRSAGVAPSIPSLIARLSRGRGGLWPQKILIRCEEMAEASEGGNNFAWIFSRPLDLRTVVAELQKAAHAARVIARQTASLSSRILLSQSIADSMSSGVTLCDVNLPHLPLVYVNPAFERMTGYLSQEVCGRNCRFLQGSDIDQPDLKELREAIRQQRETHVLLRNYRRDGTPFWNELYLSPVFDVDGHLTHIAGFQNDVTVRVESQHRLVHLANHDGLTGLARREYMMEQLNLAVGRARRKQSKVAVLFFDLNNFKDVNDIFGHAVGDTVLRVMADRFRRGTRAGEVIARMGGDEFVVILEDIHTEEHAREGMERLCALLAEELHVEGQLLHPSASVGMALYPQDGETPARLLKMADANMYLAKMQFHDSGQTIHGRKKYVS